MGSVRSRLGNYDDIADRVQLNGYSILVRSTGFVLGRCVLQMV